MSRFDELAAKLAAKGAHDPRALAAYIGRKKYGKEAFQAMAAAGRRKHGRSEDLTVALRGEPPRHTDTPTVGAVTAEPGPAQQGHHSGPVLTRAQARARLWRKGIL